MKKNILYIMVSVLLCFACQSESITEGTGFPNEDVSKRELTHITFVASLADTAATRVAYSQGSEALARHWEASEQLGVYIKNNSTGAITRAGSITSTGSTTDVTREFSGNVAKLGSGESYIYMHPDLGGNVGENAAATIAFISQSGSLASTDHLKLLIPMVWRNGNTIGEMQGYVVHLVLTFKEDPGTITSVSLQTMSMGEDGTTEDRVFPASFKTANLGNDVNSTLATEKTKGTALASDAEYADTITLTTSGTATGPATDGSYTAEAYLACADIKNLDVFRSKYNVKVIATKDAVKSTYYSDFKSFPGQSSANSTNGLAMLSNGKMYKLSAKMSKNYSTTIISESFKVNSLLGMWNQFGKGYDPQGLVAYAGGAADESTASIPTQLKGIKSSVLNRAKSSVTSGTPNWLGPATGSLYRPKSTDDPKQENVSFNNIKITADTEVFLTIVSEFGWNQNLLGYYYYPTANEGSVTSSSVTKTIVFADVSKPGHEPFAKDVAGHNNNNSVGTPAQAPIQEFETLKLVYTDEYGYSSTTFPAGTTIGFWMMIDPEANIIIPDDPTSPPATGYKHRDYDLMQWSQWRLFTNSAWNAENTFANGSSANWPSTGYTNCNFFASGDVCNGSGNPIQGLAIYGVKDNGTNNNNYAYGAMIFMVSTSDPEAMTTENKAYFNIGAGSLVLPKP